MTRESFGRLYRAYCDEIPDSESAYLLNRFNTRARNIPVLWFGYVEDRFEDYAIMVIPLVSREDQLTLVPRDNQPRVLLTFHPGSKGTEEIVLGRHSYFKGILTDFSSKMCQYHPEYTAKVELETAIAYTSNPFALDLDFMHFVEDFGTLDYSPFQDKYEKYWKETPIDVIGHFKEGFSPEERFHRYQFVIDRPNNPINYDGTRRHTITVRVPISQSGEIQRFITENRRLEIVILPYSRDESPHVFSLIQIVGPRLQAPTSMRGSSRLNDGNGIPGMIF